MDVASGMALAAAGLAMLLGHRPAWRVQVPLVLAFWAWTFITILASPGRSAEALEQGVEFAKNTGTAFLLVVLNVTSVRRLKIVAAALSLLGALVVGQAAWDYHYAVGPSPFIVGSWTSSTWREYAAWVSRTTRTTWPAHWWQFCR
jgi:hypothetical protein